MATETSTGSFREENFGGYAGWGLTFDLSVCCDDTHAYVLIPHATATGLPESSHIARIPFSNFTCAAGEILCSFDPAGGGGSNFEASALGRRKSDGLLTALFPSGNLYTFASPFSSPTLLGASGLSGASGKTVCFDPADDDIIWTACFNTACPRRWEIGTGDLGQLPLGQFLSTWQMTRPNRALCGVLKNTGEATRIAMCFVDQGRFATVAGLRWVDANANGAANGDLTATIAERATLSGAAYAVEADDGTIYIQAGGVKKVDPNWLTLAAVAGTSSGGSLAISPDNTKLVYAVGEGVYMLTGF